MRILANLNVVGTLDIDTVTNAGADTDRFLVQDANGVVRYRTGAEVASDIGAAVGFVSTLKHEVKLAVAVGKGKAVYISGSDGTNMLASLASNASEATSTKTLGLTESAGAQNAKVFVVSEGLLAGLDTSTATIGDPVWLGVDGELVYGLANKPYAPAHMVFVGLVTRVNANNGEIFVKVQNGFELQELHNVQITTTPANNTVLAYETSSSLYKMKSIATLLGYTPADDAGVVHLAGTETITGTKTFTAATTTFAKVVANSPTGGATGEGLVVGSSFKLDASGVGQSAKIYVVTKDLSDTYGSGLQIQFANIDDNKGFGFNLNTAGGYELYTKDAGAAWVKAMTVSNAQLATFHGNVKLANYTSNGFVKTTNSDGTISIDTTPYQPTSEKGQINGYASLDGGGKVPSSQLPSYVDDVVEYANLAGFPATGETGKIYVALDTNKIYRWSGTAYVEVSPTVGTIWGSITGTLSNQTDLQSALDAKVPTTREITINGTTYDLSANRTWNVGTVTGSGTANQLAYWNGSSSVAGSTFLTLNLTADNGYLILTGGATYKNADIWLNRYSDAWENAIRFQTNGTTDWYLGSSATGSNSNLEFFSYGTSSAALTLLRSNANANFGGSVGINNTSLTGYSLRVSRTMVGDTASGITSFGVVSDGTVQSAVTSGAFGFNSAISTAAAAFTLDALIHFRATQGTIGNTSAVTNQYGFAALGTMTGATNNYGFFGSLDSATGRWNLYMSGTARNYLNGDTSIGTTTGGYKLNVSGTSNFSGALTGTVGTFSDTLTGTGLRSFAVNTAQTPSNNAGWYTLARFNTYAPFLNTNGNSGIITLSFYGGGLYTPSRYRIFYFKDDANVATLKLEKYGAVDYIQEVRIRYRTGDTRYYIEIYCDSHASGLTFDVHHDRLFGYGDQLEIFGGVLSAANAVGTILASLPFVDHGTTMSSLNVVTSASFSSSLTANSFVKSGGIASQFLKADGTVDSNTYLTSYTETDTLASVTGRGASTTTAISINSASVDHVTLANRFHFIGSSNFHITNNAYYNAAFKYQTAAAANKITIQSDGAFIFDYAASGTIDTNITWTTVFSVSNAGTATASSFVKSGGTSSQFLKADGSVDSTTYQTSFGNQNANTVYAGPTTGAAAAPTFRSLVVADLPSHTHAWSQITSTPTTISGYGITDAYTKTEVDSFLQGLDPKASVKVATTGPITLSGTQTIDGIAVVAGDRVLVKDQSPQTTNGIYVVSSSGWSRASDMDAASEFPGAYVFVEQGTANADKGFVCTNDSVNLGSTAIIFVQFSGSGAYQAVLNGTGFVRMAGTTVSYVTGTASEIIAADGSKITAGTNITISGGTISSTSVGFANPMTTLGDIIYGGASGVATRLAGNTTATKQYLSQTGNGTASAAPSWATIAGSDITGAALTETDDTNVTLTLGGSPSTALLRAVSLTLGWTGQLAVSRGGTGASSFGSNEIIYGNSASALQSSNQFTFSPTGVFFINNTISAGGIAMNLVSTVNAAANNDIIYGVRISPTFNNGAFTGVTQRALGVFGNVYINGTITGAGWGGSVIGSSYGGAGTVNGILKANGSGVVSAAVAGTDYLASNFDVTGTVRARTAKTTYRDNSANPSTDAPIRSLTNTEDNWIYLDSASTEWGIYHRNIDTDLVVSGQRTLKANSIAFIGGNNLQAYICLADGELFAKSVNINGNTAWHAGNLTPQTQLNGTGFVKASGTTISYDNNNYTVVKSGSLTLPAGSYNGWYRIGISSQAVGGFGGRGAFKFVIAQTGNNLTPAQVTIDGYKDWSNGVVLGSVQDYNSATIFTQFRIATSGDYSYLEAFINWTSPAGGQDLAVLCYDNGHNGNTWSVLTGNITVGTVSPSTTYTLSRVNNTANYAGLAVGGNSVWTTGSLTNLNQLTNGPGFITQTNALQPIYGDSGAHNLNVSGQQANIRYSTGLWVNGPTTGNYSHVISFNLASDNRTVQMYLGDVPGYLWWRPNQGGTWHPWERILTSNNVGSFALPISGGYVNGVVGIGHDNSTPSSATGWNGSSVARLQSGSTGGNVYLEFRTRADVGDYAGLIFTDNNNGGYIAWRNYVGAGANDGTNGDYMLYGTYTDHIFQAGSSNAINGKPEVFRIFANGNIRAIGSSTATTGIFTAGDGGAGSQSTVVGIRVRGLNGYDSLELGIENNYAGVIRSYGNDIRYYSGHWKTVGTAATEDHSHYWYTSRNGSTDWSNVKMRLDHTGQLTLNYGPLVLDWTNAYLYIKSLNSGSGVQWHDQIWLGRYDRIQTAAQYPNYLPGIAYGIHITQTSDAAFFGLIGRGANYNDYNCVIAWGDDSPEDVFQYRFNNNVIGTITPSGALTMSSDITAFSDIRIKENITTIDNALEKVLKLRGVYYNRTDLKFDKSRKVGFIAQEVKDVIPEIVTYDEQIDRYAVTYGNTVAILVEAIKEQQKQIEELKSQIKNK